MTSPSRSPSPPAAVAPSRPVSGRTVSSNPVLSVKCCRKLKSSLSTCYLAFGASTLRLAAVQGTQRSALKFHAADVKQPTGQRKRRKHSATAEGEREQQQAAAGPSSSLPSSAPGPASRSRGLLKRSGASVSAARRGERQRRPLAAAAAQPQPRQQTRRRPEEEQEDEEEEEERSVPQRHHARHHRRSHRASSPFPSSSSSSSPSPPSQPRRHHRHHRQGKGRQRSASQRAPSSSSPAVASSRVRVVVKTEAAEEEQEGGSAAPAPLSSVHARGDSQPSSSLPRAVTERHLSECPVYRPSAAQWADPIGFVRSVMAEAGRAGMCRIVPPSGWQPPFALDSDRFQFTTRLQNIHQLQQAAPFVQGSRAYNLQQFQTLAETFKQAFFSRQRRDRDRDRQRREQQRQRQHAPASPPPPLPALPQLSTAQVEQAYWDVVCGRSASPSSAPSASASSYSSVQVEYGADLDSSVGGSGFESLQLRGGVLANAASLYAGSIGWNLRALPLLRGSLLGQLPEHVPGVSTPWLYVGMLFSSFCWHTEDSFLLSMSYLHCGASKTWYAAPGAQVLQVEQAMRREHPEVFAARPNARHSLTLQMSPHTLQARYGVDVCHTVQAAGEFVCTFPAAFHCGFSHGFNVGEAVNFATAAWLPFGRQAQQLDRQQAHPQCFSLQQLLYTLVQQRLQQREGDDDDDAVLLAEFEQLVAAEQRDRAACVTAGVSRFLPMDAAAPGVPQCAVCLLLCFLSAVQCDRCRLPPVCLQHVAFACSCEVGTDRLRVEYRVSLQQLSLMQQRLRQAVAQSQPHCGSRSSAADGRKRNRAEAAESEEDGRHEPAADERKDEDEDGTGEDGRD